MTDLFVNSLGFFFLMPVLPKSREETSLGPLSFHLAMASILSSQPEIEELFPLTSGSACS